MSTVEHPNFLKAHANGRNKCQQLPTLLGVVGQQCCVRLHGPKSLTGFKLYVTSANKCQHCCGSMQTDATSHNIVWPNNVGCCWPTMLGPFAGALTKASGQSIVVVVVYDVIMQTFYCVRLSEFRMQDLGKKYALG